MGSIMKDIYQYRQVRHIEYIPGSGKLKMNLVDSKDDYITQANAIELDVKNQDFKNIKTLCIGKDTLSVEFSEPMTCNLETGRYEEKLYCNVELEGNDNTAFVEKLPSLRDRIFSQKME